MKWTKIALVALTALTAFAPVPTASAVQYKSSATPVDLSGNQNTQNVFSVDFQNVSCTSATFTRKGLATPANEISAVAASYNGCTAFGFAANVTMGTCTYNFDQPDINIIANVDIACTNNANVNGNATNNGDARINASVFGSECEVHIESQNNRGRLDIANDNPVAGDFLLRVSINPGNNGGVNALTAERTKDVGLCPLSGVGVQNTATYNGNVGVTGNGAINLEVA